MSQKSKKFKPVKKPNTLLWSLATLGGLALLFLAAWALAKPAPAAKVPLEVQGAPKLKLNQQKIDLGNVQLGQTVSASFEVSNVGDQPLRFSTAPYIEAIEGC